MEIYNNRKTPQNISFDANLPKWKKKERTQIVLHVSLFSRLTPATLPVTEFHLLAEKSHTAVDHFYIALFSTLEQTQCTLVACDSKRAAVAFYGVFWTSTDVVDLQCCLVVIWLVPRETAAILAQVLCTPYNHALFYNVTLFKATNLGCMCVQLQPAICTFGRMTGIFYVLLRWNVMVERIPK